jgi:hypothetical protein
MKNGLAQQESAQGSFAPAGGWRGLYENSARTRYRRIDVYCFFLLSRKDEKGRELQVVDFSLERTSNLLIRGFVRLLPMKQGW